MVVMRIHNFVDKYKSQKKKKNWKSLIVEKKEIGDPLLIFHINFLIDF